MLDPALIPKPRKRAIRLYILGVLLIIIAILGLLLFKLPVSGATIFEDDFENYELGDLNTQNYWSGSSYFDVVDTIKHTGQKGIKINTAITSQDISKIGNFLPSGEFNFWFYKSPFIENTNCFFEFRDTLSENPLWVMIWFEFREDANGTGDFYRWESGTGWIKEFSDLTLNAWHQLELEWYKFEDRYKYRFKIDSSNFTNWFDIGYDNPDLVGIDKFTFSNGSGGTMAFDDINKMAEPELKIWGIDPESGTEITNPYTKITIGYQNFNWDEYKGFSIAFWDERLHTSSNTKLFEADNLNPSGTGEIIINLSDFGIDRKGKWYLTALGFGSHLDIEGGMFLTTRGYIDFWTGELVSPEYYLFINIESLPAFYPVSSFDTWYAINVEEFATPTAMAMSMANFITPILQTIGEFNDRTQEIFDTNEAYNRGFALGEIFPLISGYVNSISVFFGGFPIVSFFKYIIILMFAIFLIKAILKFIPFFGK